MKNIVCKLPKLDASSFFIAHTLWDDEEIRFSIFDNDSVWAGRFAKDDALKVSKTLGLSSEEYWTETRLALSTNNGADMFQYFLTDSRFKWVKLVAKDVIEKVEYGSVQLEAGVLSILRDTMIECLIDNSNQLAAQVKNTNEEKLVVESDRQKLRETLHRHRLEKQDMEESLYFNFLEILNSKKLKLAALQDCKLEVEVRASSPKPGCSQAKPSSLKPGCSRPKATTWRKNTRPKLAKRAKKSIIAPDSPIEQEFPFQQTRKIPENQETKHSSPPEKPKPVIEPELTDEYDGDTEIDEPPDVIKNANRTSDPFATKIMEKTPAVEFPVELRVDDNEIQMEAGCSNEPLEMTRSQLREFNTQKLLDDLGI